jgi:hypothetical protein
MHRRIPPDDVDSAALGGDQSRPTFSDRLRSPWWFPLIAFAAVWVLAVVAWQVSELIWHPGVSWATVFLFKDANIYAAIAEHGYPGLTHQPPPRQYPPSAAFYPLYPMFLAPFTYLSELVTHKAIAGQMIGAMLAGAASVVALWALAARVRDRWTADRAVLLYCAFPGAFSFTTLYSEPLAIALGALCLLAALDRKWLLAGGLGLLSTAEHSTMIALSGALGIGALQAIWERREWRALAAPLLTPLGMLAYLTYTKVRYGSFHTWFDVEKVYWHQTNDWANHTLHIVTWTDPATRAHHFFNLLLFVAFWSVVVGIGYMIAARLPIMVTIYTALVLLAFSLPATPGPKPRLAMTAFGIFIGFAAKLPRILYWPLLIAYAALLGYTMAWWPHHWVGPAP